MMNRRELENASNVSALLFQSKEESNTLKDEACQYVGPVEITNKMVVNGRGLIATRDISAGECLFVIPATVSAPVDSVYERWVCSHSNNGQARNLEEITEQILVEEMKQMLSNKEEYLTVESYLALVGAAASKNKLSSEETSALSINDVSDDELLRIIRRNGFGPDFVNYSSIEKRWVDKEAYMPRRLLGLFPLAAMINHSCSPNAVRVFAGDTMIAHACQSIKAGQEIVWSYLPPTQPYPQRQEILRSQHGFVCSCHRCSCEAKFWTTPHPRLSASSLDSWVRLCSQSVDDVDVQEARSLTIHALEELLRTKDLTSETKYFIRTGFAKIYISYLNYALQSGSEHFDDLLQRICMPLHVSLTACNNASTEHLSILHVCYEMIGIIHSASKDQQLTVNKLRFWTTQVQKACMVRYGNLGNDIESVRRAMQHTRTVLRNKDGFEQSPYCFI